MFLRKNYNFFCINVYVFYFNNYFQTIFIICFRYADENSSEGLFYKLI